MQNDIAALTLDLGGVRVTRVEEASDPILRPAEIFPDSTPEIIQANLDWLAPRFYDAESDRLVITRSRKTIAATKKPTIQEMSAPSRYLTSGPV